MIRLLSGNSRILLCVNEEGNWSQLFFPYAGQHQHLRESRVGLFDRASGAFAWAGQKTRPEQSYIDDSNAARSRHRLLDMDLVVEDMVHPNLDLIIRRMVLRNPAPTARILRLFHYQSLTIMGSLYQDTAYWDAERRTINHYKGHQYFQFWGRPDFDAFSCGEHTLKGLKGSYVDAEDGELLGSPISHGAADSIVQWNLDIGPSQEQALALLVMVDRSRHAVNDFYRRLQSRDPVLFAAECVDFWNHWIEHKDVNPAPDLSATARALYRRSVFVVKDCASHNGAIVASPDPVMLASRGDNYNYNWWRDGGYVCMAMDEVGLHRNARMFLRFAAQCQEDEGYFLHRHFLDGSVGSTWHPPPFLQIDQTATVISAAWHHFKWSGDLGELLEFWPLVRKAADFLMDFVDDRGLPKPSYDLWEEKKAVSTYSVAAVVHGLERAARVAQQLGKRFEYWRGASHRMQQAALQELWNGERGAFFKSIDPTDERLDASTLLVLKLGLLPVNDPRAGQLVRSIEDRLWVKQVGGVARYEGDEYWGRENPWLIATLWLAEAHLLLGRPERAKELIEWVARVAGPTLLLPEQVDARSGEPTSVTPLVWSHSTFLDVANRYSRHVTKTPAGVLPRLVRQTT